MSDETTNPPTPAKKPRAAGRMPARAEDFVGEREKFRKIFDTTVRKKAIKAIEVLDRIQMNSRSDMARVVAARALIEKAVPQENNLTVEVGKSYADTLRELAARMRAPSPLVIEADQTAEPAAPVRIGQLAAE